MGREEILKNLVEEFYEDFNECERAQHLLDCEYCELYKKYGKCHLGEHITGYQMPIIEKAQADLLEEFVEWQAKQYKDLCRKYDKEMEEVKDDTDYFWCSGRVAGIGEIRRRLKKDLENFLKERKDVEPKKST